MTSFRTELREKVKVALLENYLPYLEKLIEREQHRVSVIEEEIESVWDTSKKKLPHLVLAQYKSRLKKSISDLWTTPEEPAFSDLWESLNSIFDREFAEIETTRVRAQKQDRFFSLEGDTLALSTIKSCKRFIFYCSRFPEFILKGFKKEVFKTGYWKHRIPLRNLAKYHFQAGLLTDLREINDLIFKFLCKEYLTLNHWEVELAKGNGIGKSNHSALKRFKKTSKELAKQANRIIEEKIELRYHDFLVDYELVGTIEKPARHFSDSSIREVLDGATKKWFSSNKKWLNTIFALFEDWRSDLDIYILENKTRADLEKLRSGHVRKLADQIDPEIDEIRDVIANSIQTISTSKNNVKDELQLINYSIGEKLEKELLPRLSDKISSQNLSNLISKLELSIKRNVEELSDEHVIVKSNSYDNPLDDDELRKVSIYELVAFESLTKFQSQVNDIKQKLFLSLENVSIVTSDLGQIISFSIASAISAIEDGDKNEEEVKIIAIEGLERASNRLVAAGKDLHEAVHLSGDHLEEVVNTFCGEILELTVNENVGELRLRIVKAKTAKQAEEVKREIAEKIAVRKRWIFGLVKRTFRKTSKLLHTLSEKFVLTASQPVITREISDFLLESQDIINRLPLIYRRLYRIEPLEDLELFEGREKEYETLQLAFENWEKDRFAATALLGEKWGGLTSFINYSLNKAKYPYKVTRFAPHENLFSEEGLIDLMKTVFKVERFQTLDQVVEYLNSQPKQVVILEDLQNLYIRKIGGFVALQLLFQLITRTYKNVFWITSTTLYTWQYLNKAINIQEFFSYTIEMGDLSNDQIINIVWKRNRISGYNIHFVPDEGRQTDKKFIKLVESEQQAILKTEFFSSLNSFAKSNVSLALIFWLLSTRKVDKNTIEIGSFKNPDLNFLTVISMEKVYILHTLILHDGLTEKQLAEVLNTSETVARLTILSLFEDGIILQKKEVFMVNPIVYRNVVSMLKLKNLIH